MAAQSSLKNMALCLSAVCLFCSAILAAVYAVTSDPIEQAARKALELSIGRVLPEGGVLSEEMTAEQGGQSYQYYASLSDTTVLAYAVKSTAIGFGGPLTVMVGVLPDGTVYNTSVLSHSETPGLGAKCTSDPKFLANWSLALRQENGKQLSNITVTKDGGDVDAITASTITSRAYALAVSNAVALVKSIGGQVNE